ncbi:RagB/SusD family nutrient uptake outer membrane protein [Oscillospiraceae bacterium N12]|uniref:RagB/SusD family nutrient uptake outer membrane protein n=1 Tax=Jilunia laotingensis TaxID=2763675 RepID=A0A926IPP8_9BACT|nr:RagB/SusD family nutrient uptake outer membrane protein [Jilunia laotingensis]MBC8593519.1 RagB/SusD family nutrient uptake outer membrane protein [Jilunia laotingensis]
MNRLLFKIPAFSFILLFLAGCNDFLDKDVLGNSTDENFYDTQYKLQAALNATYDVLQMDLFNECEWRFGDACADDVWGSDEGLASQMGQLVQFRFNTSNEWIQNRYTINYKGIHRANQVIANAHKVKLSVYDYASYKAVREILGQAKFLRALFYFNLVKTYGGVPIRPETETVQGLVVPRNTAAEVYAYIEKDLREASIMLPARYMGTEAGKASEGAAVALLMKVLMYQATPGENSEKWQEMVRLGDFFVEGTKMTLGEILNYDSSEEDWESLRERLWFKPKELNTSTDPYETTETELPALHNAYSLDYKDYYGKDFGYIDQFFQTGEFSKGSIFEVVFKESADGSNGDTNEGTPIYDNIYSSSPQIWTTNDIINELFSSDPRRSFTIGHQQYAPDGDLCQCGPGRYLSLKWYTPLKDRPQYGGDNGKNRRLIRYAEVLLMYAEALNETNQGVRALAQLNKNKTQVNTINGSSTLYIGGGYGQMRDQIWKERRIELCFEWDRFFDLVRQKRAAQVIKTYGSKRANKRGYYFREGVNELFPIPQSEIDISNGVIEQNPGY